MFKLKQIFEKVLNIVNKQKQVVYRLFDKYQLPIFVLTNVLCNSYIFIYLIAKLYNYDYVNDVDLSNGAYPMLDLQAFNYAYQIIRCILIFIVFDIYSKLESGLIVDFIK